MSWAAGRDVQAFEGGKVITPSDATLLLDVRGIYVGGAGNVAVTLVSGEVVTFTAVPVGTILPVKVTKVMATNTTATLMLGLE
jgi:hypothetical protein